MNASTSSNQTTDPLLQKAVEKAREALATKILAQKKQEAIHTGDKRGVDFIESKIKDLNAFCIEHWKQLDKILASQKGKSRGKKRGVSDGDDMMPSDDEDEMVFEFDFSETS